MFQSKRVKELEAKVEELLKQLDEAEKKTTTVEVPQCDCAEKLKDLVANEADLRKSITSLKKEKEKIQDEADRQLRLTKEAMEDAKLQHKIAIEDIKHMHKKLEEQQALANERAIFDAEKKAEGEVKEIRRTYAEKLEKELLAERNKMQDFMQRVMDALPNVNVRLGQREKDD